MTQAPANESEAAAPETPQGQSSEKTRNILLGVLFTVTALLGLVGLIRWPGALFDEYSPVRLAFRYTLAGSPLRADAVIAGAVAATNEGWVAVREDILLALWSVLALWVLLLVFLVTSAQFGLGTGFAWNTYQTPWGRALGPTVGKGAGVAGALGVIGTGALIMYVYHGEGPDAGWTVGPVIGAAAGWAAFTLALIAIGYVIVGAGLWLYRSWSSAALPMPHREDIHSPPTSPPGGPAGTAAGPAAGDREPVLGICSSGGGLRSASFSLGAYEALSEEDEFSRARYLSSVSGGAYMAGAMTTVDFNLSPGERMQWGPYDPDSPETVHLRNNSHYLAPTSLAKAGMFGRLFLGLAFSIILIGAILTATARPWGAFMAGSVLYPTMSGEIDDIAAPADRVATTSQSIVDQVSDGSASTTADFIDEGDTLTAAATDLRNASAELESALAAASGTARALVAKYTITDDSDRLADVLVVYGGLSTIGAEAIPVADGANELVVEIRGLGSNPSPVELLEVAVAADRLASRAGSLGEVAGRVSKPQLPVPGGWWAIAIVLLLALLLGMVSVGSQAANAVDWWRRGLQRTSLLLLTVGLALFLTLVAVPWILTRGSDWALQQGTQVFAALQTIGAAILAAGAIRTILAKRASVLGTIAGGVVAPLMIIIAILGIARAGAEADDPLGGWVWVVGAIVVLIAASFLADLNTWSMHPFYRRRLESAFFKVRSGTAVSDPAPDQRRLSFYRRPVTKQPVDRRPDNHPELIIGAAANVTEVGSAASGRNAVPFTFSPTAISAGGLGSVPMALAEQSLDPRTAEGISLPSAVAISGAAVSPAMGKMTRKPLQALLALANVRLGVWLPNPAWLEAFLRERTEAIAAIDQEIIEHDNELVGAGAAPEQRSASPRRRRLELQRQRATTRQWSDRVRPTYLIKEIFGIYRPWDRYLYVTDGGHWENLGLVELLRRGCTEIYCLDAAGDAVGRFKTLSEAIMLSRTELGIEWGDIDLSRLRAEPVDAPATTEETKKGRKKQSDAVAMRSEQDHVSISFAYPDGTRGTMVYCRAAVAVDAPMDILAYQRQNPAFPAQSTLDQFYDYEQLEAYRFLGQHVAAKAVATMHTATRGRSRSATRTKEDV
jgi:MFS family permease